METGESGVNGAHVQRRANRVNNQEHVNVIHLHLSTVERNVRASPKIQGFVTRKYHVQVIIPVARLSIEVEHYINSNHEHFTFFVHLFGDYAKKAMDIEQKR